MRAANWSPNGSLLNGDDVIIDLPGVEVHRELFFGNAPLSLNSVILDRGAKWGPKHTSGIADGEFNVSFVTATIGNQSSGWLDLASSQTSISNLVLGAGANGHGTLFLGRSHDGNDFGPGHVLTNSEMTVGSLGSGFVSVLGTLNSQIVKIGALPGSSGELRVSRAPGIRGSFNASAVAMVGVKGNGALEIAGGDAVISTLVLGDDVGSNGTVTLGNWTFGPVAGTLASSVVSIGPRGTGTFNHDAGLHTVSTSMILAGNTTGRGTYRMNGSSANLVVGPTGGGTITIASVGAGTFGLVAGDLVAGTMELGGASGVANLEISGGTARLANLYAKGTGVAPHKVTISGGTLTVTGVSDFGYSSLETQVTQIVQSGGMYRAIGGLRIGGQASLATAAGNSYTLNSGSLEVDSGLIVRGSVNGVSGREGAFQQNGGSVVAGNFLVDGLNASYTLQGGTLSVTGPAATNRSGVLHIFGGTLIAPYLNKQGGGARGTPSPSGAFDWQGGTIEWRSGNFLINLGPDEIFGETLNLDNTLGSPKRLISPATLRANTGSTVSINGGELSIGTIVLLDGGNQLQFNQGTLMVRDSVSVSAGGLLGPTVSVGAGKAFGSASAITINGGTLALAGGAISAATINTGGQANRFSWTTGTLAITGPNGLSIGPFGPTGVVSGPLSISSTRGLSVTNELNFSGTTITQTGGSVAAGNLFGENSEYHLSGGSLTTGGASFLDSAYIQTGGTHTVNGLVADSASVSVSGGTLAANTIQLNVSGLDQTGGVVLAGQVVGSGLVQVSGNGSFTAGSFLQQTRVKVNGGRVGVFPSGVDAHTSHVFSLEIADGTFDLANNGMVITFGSTKPQIEGYVRAARNGGAWNGDGLTSSTARDRVGHITGLGAISGAEYTIAGGTGIFHGQNYTATNTLVLYTFNGDTDLNGLVDFDDYSRIDNGFNNNRTGWFNGDFDYNGIIDFDDYSLIDQAFNTQSGSLRRALSYLDGSDRSDNGMNLPALQRIEEHFAQFGQPCANAFLAAVPEPTMAVFAAASGGLSFLRRRRT